MCLNPKLILLEECCISEKVQKIPRGTIKLYAVGGSVLDFDGDACVNAANEGGITGFGIDELVNRAGGFQMVEARRALNGIPTGEAKSTPSFNHKKVKYVIHAVGPVFRKNALSKDSMEVKFVQLRSAYESAMRCVFELGCDSVAFCLISAGVFRGNMPLDKVISVGIEGILDFYKSQVISEGDLNAAKDEHAGQEESILRKSLPSEIYLCAFTDEEQMSLTNVISNL